MAYHQKSSVLQNMFEVFENFLLGRLVEIDDHISAKDTIHLLPNRIRSFQKIYLMEFDHGFDLRFYLVSILISAGKIFHL